MHSCCLLSNSAINDKIIPPFQVGISSNNTTTAAKQQATRKIDVAVTANNNKNLAIKPSSPPARQ